MNDIIIPYKYDDANDDLRFALRSIEKNLSGYGKIYIVSDRLPKWIKNVIHIHENGTSRKQKNICDKLLKACDNENITDDFIQWQDDIYLLQSLKEINYWTNGSLKDALNRNQGTYKDSIIQTAKIIGDNEYPYFDTHTPIVYNKEKFKAAMQQVDWKDEYIIKTLYCFYVKAEPAKIEDIKITVRMTVDQIKNLISGKLFFSTNNNSLKEPMIKVLNELFPGKSNFES